MSCHDAGGRRRYEDSEFTLHVYPGALSEGTIYCPVSARKVTSAAEVIERVIERLQLDRARFYVLAEVKEFGGEEWILNPCDCPVQRMMLWPRMALENRLAGDDYRFLLREKDLDGSILYGNLQMWLRVTEERRRMVERGLLPQPPYVDDLCALPDLNERTLLENLRGRFRQEKIYTYVGGILIVVNPFKFLPIYNPKYVKMYDKQRLGKLEPHIYAVADAAYHAMLQRRRNQCIVISGESGSGKTQSTNFLIHHLTALSQKGFASGVEQIILGAGPVLEAFGNAKTAHNNNSSRFGKFIQVNYQESGTVRGAYVEKYLLEKSRLVYQEHNERNYHVFYYLLAGASEEERKAFHLLKPEEYHYLNQDCFTVEGEDLKHDFERLQLAMEMVGFLPTTRKQIFSLLSAILLLGNIRYKKKTFRDDSIDISNPEVLPIVSELLEVKEEMLFEALTTRKTVTVGERLIVPYKLAEVRRLFLISFCKIFHEADVEMCVCVFQILSIGVLDIFGFEDYENNSFEQFCINFANETLQHYFNQHVFKLEQEEYRSEGISWHMIDYMDNTACINLISKKPTALLHLLDEECNFPQASNQTLLDKFKRQHEGSGYIEFPAVMEPAFIIRHYAGKVKYSVKDFREKNTDHMRPDIVALLKSSRNAFICGLMGIDPVATFRWAVIRAYFRAHVAFREAGKRHKEKKTTKTSGEKQCHYKPDPSEPTPHSSALTLTLIHSVSNSLCFCRRSKNCKTKPSLPKVMHFSVFSMLTQLCNIYFHFKYTFKKCVSLNKLMETLGQSEPYFVKCIRSNAEKLPLRFSDVLVLRQLRYTGMLETVRIRRSGYSVKYSFQDFAHHFRVLLPAGFHSSQTGIRQFLQSVDLEPNGHQVGRSTVFLRERLRQRLQEQLHQEVLRRIVCLQRSFRTQQERRRFCRQRRAATLIQRWWRACVTRADAELQQGAAVCLQAAWRGFRERQLFLRRRRAALIIQTSWRRVLQTRHSAACLIQSSWRSLRQRRRFLQQRRETQSAEAPRSVDDSTLKSRSKRESRRQRELQQATFSLELLKVRSASVDDALPAQIPLYEDSSPVEQESAVQKEIPVDQSSLEALQTPETMDAEEVHRETHHRANGLSSPDPPEPQTATSSSSKPLQLDSRDSDREVASEPKKEVQKKFVAQSISMKEKAFSPKRIFLDEFMMEYKPMNGTISKVKHLSLGLQTSIILQNSSENFFFFQAPKPERKKRRKKESDTVSHLDHYTCVKGFMNSMLTLLTSSALCCPLQVEEHMGHIFKSTQYSIPTYCEFCSSLIWMMDKACVFCRYACHRKCCLRMTTTCSKKFDPELSSRQFGVELSRLTSDERAVPLVVEKLINYIEMHGLYTEGIYRKSGSTNKIKELKQGLDTDANSVNLDDYNIHVIASVLKQWLRDLPNPLMTFELYEEFLRAMGLQDKREVVQGVYSVIDQLSRTHLSTLERLIFHLVRISFQEETNRMSSNALAIVFAPCILRCPDTTDPLQSVRDISKTTACVELIICEQMRKYKARLKDINTLEFAENKAKSRLTHIRRSMVRDTTLSDWTIGFFPSLILSLVHGKCHTSSRPVLFPDRRSSNPVFFPSLLPCPLLPILLFQKPVLIAVRFIGITRTAPPVCIHECVSVSV
uniref:Myosin IXAb n=1 Tax=Cyprinus carpio TaxID=7962 RepID=A0A8C1UQ25_CYPCA